MHHFPPEFILQAIWPGISVSDAVLTVCIGEIRQALGNDRQAPRYIETLHRRGYRFLGAIAAAPGQGDAPEVERSPEAVPSRQIIPSPAPLSSQPSTLSPVSVVGREAQVSQLEARLNQAWQGQRQVVFVAGEAGIGKTTLVNAFLARVTSRAGFWVARGQCMAHYGVGEAYLPVLDALGRVCREPGSAPLLTGLAQHAPTWLAQMPALLGTDALEALQRRIRGTSREHMLRELAEALEVLTVERPLILVLEDLHWSDYATLDLVSWLARRREPARLLVLGTYRPVDVIVRGHPLQDVKQELLRHGQCAELALELLTGAEVMQYLAERFGVDKSLTPSFGVLAQSIHQRTDGHPLFVVMVTDALVQQRRLVERNGRWEVQRGIEEVLMAVPESLQQWVEQQLLQLSTEEQRVLEAASATGMQFSVAAVAAGLGERDDVVEGWCSTLARRGQFLQSSGVEEWPDGTVVGCYRFRHTLNRQVVYDRLPVGKRIQLHARIGTRQESGYQDVAAEHAAELATHFEQGREHRRALHYLRLAADKALQRYAYQEAIAHLNRGLTVLLRLPETQERHKWELDLQIALGQVLTVSQGPGGPAVVRVYGRAEELCRQVGDIEQRIAVVRGLHRTMQGRGDPKRARPLAEEFLRLAQQAQDAALLMEGHIAFGVCLFYLGQVSMAHTHLQAGLAIYDAERPQASMFPAGQDLRVLGLTYDAMVLWVLGSPEQAGEQSRRAVELAEEVAQPWALAMALGYATLVEGLCGERQAALESAEATIQLAMEQGIASWVGRGMMLRGWALAEQGQAREGLAQVQQGLAVWQANGQELGKPFWLALLAETHAKVEQVREGLQVLAEAVAIAQTRELRVWEAELHRLQGKLLLQQAIIAEGSASASNASPSTRTGAAVNGLSHPFTAAETCFRQALEIACTQEAKSLELRAAISLSQLWQQQGKQEAALQRLKESYHRFTEGFHTADLEEARTLLDQLAS